MASGASSRDPEQAARVLGVPSDASRETVEQAYRDLREVWNPERFGQDERLRSRAQEQLRQIEDAYVVLRRRSLPDDPLYEVWAGRTRKPHPKASVSARPPTSTRSPSLADTVFAPGVKPGGTFAKWIIVVAAVALCILGAVFLRRGSGSESGSPGVRQPSVQPPPVTAPPPVNSSPQVLTDQATAGEDKGEDSAAQKEEQRLNNSAAPSSGATRAGEPRTIAPPASAEKPAQVPARREAAESPTARRSPEASKPAGKGAEPSDADSLPPGEKPQLLRGPEDEKAEAAKRQEAFGLLRQKSEAARRLIDGNLGDLRFVEWQAIPRDSGQIWIDVIAIAAGENIHFIWAVDPAKQTIRPLSQAARDLEAARH